MKKLVLILILLVALPAWADQQLSTIAPKPLKTSDIDSTVQGYDEDLADIADKSTSEAYQFGTVTATGGVVGNVTGNVTGNVSGSSGSCTGNAATATTATTANAGDSATAFFSSGTIEHERGGLEADVSGYDGVMKITGGSTGYIKYNFGTSIAPDADNDVDEGYSVGSKWYDTTADVEYTCLDATDGAAVWSQGGGDGSSVYLCKVIAFPDQLQIETGDWPLWPIEDDEYESGITITDIGIKTPTSSNYTIDLLEYTSPDDGSPSTIESGIATSSSCEAEDDGTLADASIAAGSIIYVDLDPDDVSWVMVWVKGYKN